MERRRGEKKHEHKANCIERTRMPDCRLKEGKINQINYRMQSAPGWCPRLPRPTARFHAKSENQKRSARQRGAVRMCMCWKEFRSFFRPSSSVQRERDCSSMHQSCPLAVAAAASSSPGASSVFASSCSVMSFHWNAGARWRKSVKEKQGKLHRVRRKEATVERHTRAVELMFEAR